MGGDCYYIVEHLDYSQAIFDGLKPDPEVAFEKIRTLMEDYYSWFWQNGQHVEDASRTGNQQTSLWQRPPLGIIKINCDAALSGDSGKVEVVAVTRNQVGVVMDVVNIFKETQSIHMAKAKAVSLVVLMATKKEWKNIIVQLDSSIVIEDLKRK